MKKKIIVFTLIVFALISCQKQKAPTFESEEVQRAEEMDRLRACTEVNFNHGVLLHQNALLLFKCTKWDKDFPHMFEAMKKISAGSWDQLIGPVNESFLENKERKNKFFKAIRELDKKGGLEDLSYVIAALNESNFFDALRSMFLCIDNPMAKECKNRQDRIPSSRRPIKQILHALDIPSEVVEQSVALMKEINRSIEPLQEPLRGEINKFKSSPLMTSLKIQLADEVFKKIKEGLQDKDREFISKVLLTSGSDGKTPWIYSWLQDERLGREKFRDLLEYPALTNPAFVSDMRGFKEAYDSNFTCSIYKDESSNELIQFDFKTHLADYVSVVKNKSYKSFFDFTSNDIAGLKLSTPICSELENNRYNVNFIKFHTNVAEFLKEKKNYEIFKFLVTQTDTPFDVNSGFAKNLYLFDIIAGDIFLKTKDLGQEILKSTREFYPTLFDVMKNAPQTTYINAGEVAQEVFKKEYDLVFKGFSDYWLFLNSDEKNFALNFVDRHFDNGVKYVMLFDFYLKLLEDYRDVRPIFHKAWIENQNTEDWTIQSVEDFAKHMSGKEALHDFKKFFSRNQIIKVLEVLSSGQKLAENAKEELNYHDSTQYLLQAKTEKYIFSIKDEEYDAGSVVECMKNFSNVKNSLYDLVRNFPSACQKVTTENIAFRLFGWMNEIEKNYLIYKKPENESSSLLDREGLLSPYMLNSQLALLKIIDSVIGPYQSNTRAKGLEYLLSSTNYHLNTMKAAPLVEKNIAMINQWQDLKPEDNVVYRNSLIKTLTKAENFSTAKDVFNRVGKLLVEYGLWVKSGDWKKATERSLGTYDPRYECSNIINQQVAPNPCPKAKEIKEIGSQLLDSLSYIWEKEEGSPISQLLLAHKAGEGLDIPLDSKKAKKYRMSLTETFKYLYDTSDTSFDINKIKIQYKKDANTTFNEPVTTLERIETVIREVNFDYNYLGVSYLNHVVAGDNYIKDVQERKDILSKCVKIPGIRCGKPMSESDLRMAHNALASYDGLLDANRGPFQYGDYLKAFQQTLVGSSAKEAQAVTFFPFGKEKLKKHNGKVLGYLTQLTGFSNAARVIRDRIGREREDFENFLNRSDFKRVDRTLMNGFDLKQASESAENLLKKIKDKHILDDGVDWISSLSYDELRLVEDTVARLLVVGSYLGTPELVFEKSGYTNFDERYKDNNIFQLFLALEKIVNYWPNLKQYFPNDAKLIDLIKPINTGLYFLTEKLNSTTDPEQNMAYLALNDLSLILQATLFDDFNESNNLEDKSKTNKGLNYVLALLDSPEKLDYAIKTTRENYRYLDVFHKKDSELFLAVGQNLQRLSANPKLDLTPLRDYLRFTTKKDICLDGVKPCEKNYPNYHYDEVASLTKYLQQTNELGETNFMLLNKRVFLENIDQVIQMITDLFPAIKIKEIKPPLIL